MTKENILIVTYNMIPYSIWGSCQRMFYLGNYLQTNGFNVFLIHYKGNFYGDFGEKILFNPLPLDNVFISLLSSKRSQQSMKHENTISHKGHTYLIWLKNHMKFSLLFLEKTLYNEQPGSAISGSLFIKRGLSDIIHTIELNNIQKILISGPPFALFKLGKILKKTDPSLKIILDYRDPWNLWRDGSFIAYRKEKDYLRFADKIIFVNDVIMKDTIQKFDLDTRKCDIILNGYSEQSWQRLIVKNKKFNLNKNRLKISCIGAISFESDNNYRNVNHLLDAVNRFKHKDVELIFVGVNDFEKIEKIREKLNVYIECVPFVDHEISLEYMLMSDILLVIHTDSSSSKYILTGKLFDYVRSGKVIFGIGDENANFIKFIKKYRLGVTASNNVSSIMSALELIHHYWENGLIDKLREGFNGDYNQISEFSREYQNSKYMDIIKYL